MRIWFEIDAMIRNRIIDRLEAQGETQYDPYFRVFDDPRSLYFFPDREALRTLLNSV